MKMIQGVIVLLFTVALSNVVFAESFILLDEQSLLATKTSLANGQASTATVDAYARLIARADKSLRLINPTVMDKTIVPPSGNKHDYLSLSRYWWPDPNTKDGLPWIRKDGKTNPETQTGAVDRDRFGKMVSATNALALAYYYSENEAYAQKAVSLLKNWFLADKTRMNPHLKYAQSVPGNSKIRRSGILDGRLISVSILDDVMLLSTSPHWSSADNSQFNLWLSEYLDWLTESPTGKLGALQDNNHGSWYRFQVAAIAWYLGNRGLLENTIEVARRSLDEQLDANGGQTHELARTRSFFYSCFNLEALTGIAIIGQKAGVPFWDYQSSNGKSLMLAIDYLIPVAEGGDWKHPTNGIDLSCLAPILGRLPESLKTKKFREVQQNILADMKKSQRKNRSSQSILDKFAL